MTNIQLTSLFEVPEVSFLTLMNNPKVNKFLPLLDKEFTSNDYKKFIINKSEMWEAYNYGPYAIKIDDEFCGWGGFQPEQGHADFALILDPNHWGYGFKIFIEFKKWFQNNMSQSSFTAALPPIRDNQSAIKRMGFTFKDTIIIEGMVFKRYKYVI